MTTSPSEDASSEGPPSKRGPSGTSPGAVAPVAGDGEDDLELDAVDDPDGELVDGARGAGLAGAGLAGAGLAGGAERTFDAVALPRTRLDRALVEALGRDGAPVPSRAEVQRWIEDGRVTVDGVALRGAAARTPARGVVRIMPAPAPTTLLVGDATVPFEVVFEDEWLIVVDKPAGVVVHPARGHREGTLVQGLLARPGWPRVAGDPRDPEGALRPGVVHRIDRGTSGLLVVAKSARAREGLKDRFARHDLERTYVAIASGVARDATLDTAYGRHPSERLRMTSRSGLRRAVTHVRVLEALAGATLVECRLETGRTHQIRVHLAEVMGTPVVGDPIYGRAPARGLVADVWRSLGRQALHARRLGFVHPVTGVAMVWESPLPDDLARVLERLRSGPSGL